MEETPGRDQTCSQGAWKQSLRAPGEDLHPRHSHCSLADLIILTTWTTYLLYGPAAAPLGSLDTFSTQFNTIRGWHFPRRYTHTHTRWIPSWPVRDHQGQHHHREVSNDMQARLLIVTFKIKQLLSPMQLLVK